jgi:hypothetical protein
LPAQSSIKKNKKSSLKSMDTWPTWKLSIFMSTASSRKSLLRRREKDPIKKLLSSKIPKRKDKTLTQFYLLTTPKMMNSNWQKMPTQN